MYFENFDLNNIVTPVKYWVLEKLLHQYNYDKDKTQYLVNGFREGFSIQYHGPTDIQQTAPNLKFHIGDEVVLWNKVMKEVKLKRYAGPFKIIPFKNFIQSPIGLVPKDNGKNTRLIFHLSYPRGGKSSVNVNTPRELCHVKYQSVDDAVQLCLREGVGANIAKSDLESAFRTAPLDLISLNG